MRRVAVFAAGLAAALGLWAATPAAPAQPVAVAKTCSAGYTHAVIGGQQKCLRTGEYCAHRYDRQYKRYGYRCIRRDKNGRYHLTRS
ncbi:MAG: hypothetical protein ACXVRE_01955 [Gaiellaceae bacterium]